MLRILNRGIQIFFDILILSAAYWLSFMLRFDFNPELQFDTQLFFTWPYVVLLKYLLMSAFGVPKFTWRYIGLLEMSRIFYPLAITSGILVALRLSLGGVGGYAKIVIIPLGILGIDFVLSFLGITGARVLRRIVAERQERSTSHRKRLTENKRTLLIGAGRAGVMVCKEIAQNPQLGMELVGFVDDDMVKIGKIIQGQKVIGDTTSLGHVIRKTGAQQVIITITSSNGSSIRRIIQECKKADIPVKIIPGIYEILGGKVNLSRIREVTIDDLLGREPVTLDKKAIEIFLTNKRVLITGAGGSIGSETCRQISRFKPASIILVEQAENALYHIHSELLSTFPEISIEPCIADIKDFERIDNLFNKYKPHIVFHAAAHKHVPMLEWNPGEAIKNNVFGTKNIINAADKHGVNELVMFSTDKAVNPTSIMGATKRCAEIYLQSKSQESETKLIAVRFGNVLGSEGSVIPLFKKQIAAGGPVTVTHPEMKRYFMTIPEACQLVMQAATMGQSGDIFVLDMGKPVLISDLAKDLIHLSGFSENEIEIKYIGIRPGEKLFEELAFDSENITKTFHSKIYIGKIASSPFEEVEKSLKTLEELVTSTGNSEIRKYLKKIVPEMLESDKD
jgi:FlaA1/EpsC-like NDP-sugar epimerase